MKIKSKTSEKEQPGQERKPLQTDRPAWVAPLLYLCFVFVAFVLYSNTFQSPYIFDDWQHIEANPHIQIASLSWDEIRGAGFDSPLRFRPVAYITLALNYYFHGFNVAGYHLVNILIHLAAGIFLYIFLGTTLSLPQVRQQTGDAGWLPFAAAMIWLVHPVHVQSVTYIIQRMNSLAAMFYILAMLLYVKGRLARGKGKQAVLFLSSLASGVLALGSKENAATLPFFILLYEWFFLQDLSFAWLRKRLLPLLGVSILLVSVMLLFLGQHPIDRILNSYGSRDFDMGQRVLTQIRVVLFYISLLVFPHPARLNIDHHFQLSLSLFHSPATLLSLGLLLGLFGLAIMLAKRERIIAFSIFWFLGNLVIESSVIGLEMVFEHRTYLPSMLAVLAIVMVCSRVLTKKWLQVAVVILVVALFSTWTYQRNLVWKDEVTLYRDAVAKSPAKSRAISILANALERNHEYEEAEYYYLETLRQKPGNADEIHYNLGNVLMAQRKFDEAVLHFREAVSLSPERAVLRLNLAYVLALQRRDSEASQELHELLRLHPKDARAHNNLGVLLMKQGNLEEAAVHFSEAVKLQPKYKNALRNLEVVLGRMQKETRGQ